MKHEFFEDPIDSNYRHVEHISTSCPLCHREIRFLCPPQLSSDREHIKFLENRLTSFQRRNIELEITISKLNANQR